MRLIPLRGDEGDGSHHPAMQKNDHPFEVRYDSQKSSVLAWFW